MGDEDRDFDENVMRCAPTGDGDRLDSGGERERRKDALDTYIVRSSFPGLPRTSALTSGGISTVQRAVL